jgi:imidazolonepropionase-like amidohydrolase
MRNIFMKRRIAKNITKPVVMGLALLGAMTAGSLAQAQTIAITNAEIHLAGPSAAPRTISNGTIVIDNGIIRAVGPQVEAPLGATIINAEGMPVTPGLFASLSGVGLVEISLNEEGNDATPDWGFALSASLDAQDALNTESALIPISRSGGVTRVYTTTNPGDKLFGGCGLVMDLSGSDDPITADCLGQHMVMGFAGANRSGGVKSGSMALLRYWLEEALIYERAPASYRANPNQTGLSLPDIQALVPYAKGEKPLLVEVESAPDIRRLIALKEEYGLDLILVSAREAWRVGEELADAGIPVILNPADNLPSSFEALGASLANAALLDKAGVLIAFYDNDIGYTHNVRLLPQLAGNAVANGLDHEAALAAITLNPAKIWGLDARLGTIQAGKIADLVIWDGDPLEVTTRPVKVFINGDEMSLENRQSLLAERYKDLTRGDRPPAYRSK